MALTQSHAVGSPDVDLDSSTLVNKNSPSITVHLARLLNDVDLETAQKFLDVSVKYDPQDAIAILRHTIIHGTERLREYAVQLCAKLDSVPAVELWLLAVDVCTNPSTVTWAAERIAAAHPMLAPEVYDRVPGARVGILNKLADDYNPATKSTSALELGLRALQGNDGADVFMAITERGRAMVCRNLDLAGKFLLAVIHSEAVDALPLPQQAFENAKRYFADMVGFGCKVHDREREKEPAIAASKQRRAEELSQELLMELSQGHAVKTQEFIIAALAALGKHNFEALMKTDIFGRLAPFVNCDTAALAKQAQAATLSLVYQLKAAQEQA